jgi:uncharacterized protein involved in cysteine biosynthesis
MESTKATLYFGISGLALIAGMISILTALVTALADITILALYTTYIQIGIAAFLCAIWFGLLAMFIEVRHRKRSLNP